MSEVPADAAAEDRGRRMTEGDLRRTIFWLALPALAEQFLIFLVGYVDTWLAGNYTGEDVLPRNASAAVGTGAYIGWLSSLLFGMVGTGTTALVSRLWGERNYEQANRVANRSIALAGIAGSAVCALFFFGAPLLADILGMTEQTRDVAVRYLQMDAFGHLFFSFSVIGAAALRGAGDTRSPMFILGLVSVLNLVLSPLLVYGPGPIPAMGVDGIVTGTVIARFCGGVLMLVAFARGISGLKLHRRELLIRGDVVLRILRIGIPAAIDGAMIWSAQLVFLKIISVIDGSHPGAYAAHMVGIQMEAITYLPAVAWGYAAATMAGQSLGAKNPDRAKQGGHIAVRQCAVLIVFITAAFVFGADLIYQLMHRDVAVREQGVPAFRLNGLFQIPLVMTIIYLYALRGAGDTRFPMVINLFGVIGIRLPVAWICGVTFDLGLLGAWIGMLSDVTTRAVLMWWRFSAGSWTRTRV